MAVVASPTHADHYLITPCAMRRTKENEELAVDMHEWKFISRLRDTRLAFTHTDIAVSPEVRMIEFPAWRALFTSLLLWGHSTGYRLPTFDEFYRRCREGYTQATARSDDSHVRRINNLRPWFDGDEERRIEGQYEPQVKERFRGFYESGMAETYLYVCLVDAFEDALNEGVVFYDTRHDWKLKGDVTAVVREKVFLVSLFRGAIEDRAAVEAFRDRVERIRKANTMNSAHWNNQELRRWTKLQLGITDANCQIVNGVQLPAHDEIHAVIDAICDTVGIMERVRFPARRGQDIPRILRPGE